ncbi:MAG: DsbA family protein, partial [Gammaproteobacteria bacterium]|nr:DsbA family protein [Gammaproteobacteria bacterium]
FAAYFFRGENIGDVDVLVDCAAAAGMEPSTVREYLESETDIPQIQAQDAMARQMGIQGVPFFVFARKYAVSGAQSPEVFVNVFDTLREEATAIGVSE